MLNKSKSENLSVVFRVLEQAMNISLKLVVTAFAILNTSVLIFSPLYKLGLQ